MNFTVELGERSLTLTFDEESFKTIEWMGKKSKIHTLLKTLLDTREKARYHEEEQGILLELKKLTPTDQKAIIQELRRRLDVPILKGEEDGELERTDQ